MTSLVSAAPGGASMLGTEMAGPPGCASGTGGRSNRSRSRPGWALGGTICAPGGTTCATAANETLTIAKAAAMARTHASMPPTLDERAEILRYGQTRSQRRQLSCFSNSSRCFKKVTPASRDAAGSWVPRPVIRAPRPSLDDRSRFLSRGPRFGSGVENGCFRRPKGLIGTKAASAIALAMAPGWGDRRDRANLWRKATSPGTGANATKKGKLPAARRNFVRRQRQDPLRVSAAGLLGCEASFKRSLLRWASHAAPRRVRKNKEPGA